MTEAEIEKEAERRLKLEAKETAPAPAPKKPSREEWLSYNPGGDYDEAMKERDSSPMGVVSTSNYENTQAKLQEAQRKIEEENAKKKSTVPGLDIAKSFYDALPEDAKPLALGASGYAGGKALRAVLPQESVMGTPEYRDVQKERQGMLSSREPLRQEANAAITANMNAEDAHLAQRQQLTRQAQNAQHQYELHQQQLREAQLAHANAQTLNFEDELARRSGTGSAPKLSTAPELTPASRGGEGASNYALKFGATEEEARRVPSMSVMQQQNIPAQQEAWNKIPKIAPTFEAVKESPLILGTEGQQAVRERLANEARAEQQRKDQIAAEHQRIRDEIARQKAQAQIDLENAHEQARLSAKAVAAAEKNQNTHITTPSVNPKDQSRAQSLEQEYRELVEKLKKTNPSLLAQIGQIGGRFVPGMGAAVAPVQAAKAKEYLDKNDMLRASIYGIGSLGALGQATGIPPLVGAGNLMQIPSAGLSLYDLANEKDKRQP
jgi:hypothetical protein